MSECRPYIGERYRDSTGEDRTVAAIWPGGVVFDGGPTATLEKLRKQYAPTDRSAKHAD